MSSRGRAAADAVNASRRRSSRGPPISDNSAASTSHGVADVSSKRQQMLRVKVLSMGDAAVGKSCIIKRYCEERFVSKYISTIGIDYGVKPASVGGRDVRVNFWDMSGSEAFFEVRNEFYKDASGAILVYDVASRASFDSLPKWLEEARKYGAGNDIPIMLCANKVDKKRTVLEAEGVAFAAANGLQHWEISAQSGMNTGEVFEALFKEILARPPVG